MLQRNDPNIQFIVMGYLDYFPITGLFIWKKTNCKGKIAGSLTKKGYRQIRIDGIMFRAHNLAWLIVNGCWPVNQLDHEDRNPDNNIFTNLREATFGENNANRTKPKNNNSGFVGVSFHSKYGKYQTVINVNKKCVYIGYFDDPIEAVKTRDRYIVENNLEKFYKLQAGHL